ncbi:UNVERIFIED_CONTAM: hypothetical protein K2H54_005792 [Gekko kuhli]
MKAQTLNKPLFVLKVPLDSKFVLHLRENTAHCSHFLVFPLNHHKECASFHHCSTESTFSMSFPFCPSAVFPAADADAIRGYSIAKPTQPAFRRAGKLQR